MRNPRNFCYGYVGLFSVAHKDQKALLQKEIILKSRFKRECIKTLEILSPKKNLAVYAAFLAKDFDFNLLINLPAALVY